LENALPLIREIKEERDCAVSSLVKTLACDVKALFASDSKRISLASAVKDWHETLSGNTLQHLFPGAENRILNLLATVTNDEPVFIQRLGKAMTSLRIEDWNADTIKPFLHGLQTFKETVEEYEKAAVDGEAALADHYKISFADEDGNEITKTFSKTEYSKKAKLLLHDLTNAIEEMGESITEQEKRQVLMDLLQKHC